MVTTTTWIIAIETVALEKWQVENKNGNWNNPFLYCSLLVTELV